MESLSAQIINLCNKHIKEFRIHDGEAIAKYCPFCHGGDSKDVETFGIGLYNGSWSCKRGKCGKTGSFRQLCEIFGERFQEGIAIPTMPSSKTYVLPEESMLLPLTEECKNYFATRCISEETLEAFHVSSDDKGNIVFPFYWDETLRYVKYRKPRRPEPKEPKEWAMKDTEPILFGMDHVSFNRPLYITEGEIDTLSLYEAGITNVVSVPAGCNNMSWITSCWDWIEKFQQIVIFGDADEPGVEMVNMLMKRLGEDRCLIAPQYPDLVVDGVNKNRSCKDANEILYCYGPEFLAKLARSCQPAPVKGVLNLADVAYVDPTLQPRIYTRIPKLDQAIGGLGEGAITVFTGKRGHGKSTLNGQLLLNAIQQNYKVCAYSGELPAYKFLDWIMTQATESKYIGLKNDERNGRRYTVVSQDIQKRIREWIDGKFFLFDNSCTFEENEEDAIVKVFTLCARRYGCKLFLCDNLMTVTNGYDEEIKAQARFVSKLKNFAVSFKAHVLLVAHPRKTQAGQAIGNDDVSGSSVISNLADNVIVVEKPNLRIIKNRDFGICDLIDCTFNPANRRIYQTNFGDRTIYGWNHDGIQVPEVRADMQPEYAIQKAQPAYPLM